MNKNPLLQNQDKKVNNRLLLGAVAVFVLTFYLLVQGRYTSMQNHMYLYYAMMELEHGQETTMQATVPFAWDRVYTFPTGTSKQEMADSMGISVEKNLAVTSGAELQFYFVHQDEIVCAVVGNPVSVGFSFDWDGDVLDFSQELGFTPEVSAFVLLRVIG